MSRGRVALYVTLSWALLVIAASLGSVAMVRLLEGGSPGLILAVLIGIALLSFLRATIRMSRDLASGHYARFKDGPG